MAPITSPAEHDGTARRMRLMLLAAVALLLTAIRLGLAAQTGLVDDEAYYRLWSLAPSLSYLDHPPMIAWIIGAGRAAAGDTAFGVRLFVPLLHLAGVLLLWRTATLLYGERIGIMAAWILLAMPLLSLGGILATPDLPSVFFAGLVLWGLAELEHSQNARWWLAIGVFAGLGLLSKYTNLFVGATILIWIVAVRENHKWLRAPQLWLGGAIAMLLAMPVVIWNAEHQWASFAKQFGRVTHQAVFAPQYVVELAGGYLALASPIIAVLSIIGLFRVARRALSERGSADTLLAATVLPMLAYFTLHALHDRVQGNWPAPIYPALAMCAALAVDDIANAVRRSVALWSGVALGLVMSAAIFIHAARPIDNQRLAKDPTRQMRGWADFSNELSGRLKDSGTIWIATSSYALTGQLAFGFRDRVEVAQLDERLRYEFLPKPPAEILNAPALYVALRSKADPELLRAKFRKVESLESITRQDGSRGGAVYEIYRVSDPISTPLADELH